ncbi:MAG: MFS transporter [Oscillospiraceae bacterium]|nr:MFS transporter [Oscillospiraceae bacterium]
MKFKMTPQEKKWVLYDVGNSAFTMLVATLLPIYFHVLTTSEGISETDYLAYWGYTTSIATIIVAVLGPTLGTASDIKGVKKIIFMAAMFIGAIGCIALGFIQSWLWFLILFAIAKIAYQLSLVVYDSMLTDVTSDERMDEISSQGYAWGYIGSCVPFIICIAIYALQTMGILPISLGVAMAIDFIITAVWWVAMAIPLVRSYKQVHYVEKTDKPVVSSLKRLGGVFKELGQNKKALFFLIAFFFYIDGVYTIIDMATTYGESLGLSSIGLVLALLVTQFVAFPAALFFGRLSRKYESGKLLIICIVAYFFIVVYAIFLRQLYQFWILAVAVGLFQGAIQSLSRSYFAKIIPPEKSGEYFGIYDICGKGASFIGTTLVAVITQITDSSSIGVGGLAVMFVIGLIFFIVTDRTPAVSEKKQ